MIDGYRERSRDSEPQPNFGLRVHPSIHESQQLTSPTGFLDLKLAPPPCAVILVLYIYIYYASGQQLKRIGHLQMDLPQVNGATHLDASRATFLLKCPAGSGRRNG